MLDALMLELANAEQKQKLWLNSIVNGSLGEEKEANYKEIIVEEVEKEESEEKAGIITLEVDFDINDNEELRLTRTTTRHLPTN